MIELLKWIVIGYIFEQFIETIIEIFKASAVIIYLMIQVIFLIAKEILLSPIKGFKKLLKLNDQYWCKHDAGY